MQKLLSFSVCQVVWLAGTVALCQGANRPATPSVPIYNASEPSDSSITKPSFTSLPPTHDRLKEKAPAQTLTPEEVCPDSSFKPKLDQLIPKEIKGEIYNYDKLVFTEIYDYWVRHQYHAASKPRTLAVYFTIKPDGSYTMPVITSSSGKREYDQSVMVAIRARDRYPPLPRGMTEPLQECYRFGYNLRSYDSFTPNYGDWQKPDPGAKP